MKLSDEIARARVLSICKENNLEFLGFATEDGKYNNFRTRLRLKCKNCGYIWDTVKYEKFILRKNCCPVCVTKKYHRTVEEKRIMVEKRCEELGYVFHGFTDNECSKLKLECTKCGAVWDTTSFVNFFRDRKSHKCNRKSFHIRPKKRRSDKEIKEEIKKNLRGTSLDFLSFRREKYVYVQVKCKKCGEVLDYTFNIIRYSKPLRCKKCEKLHKFSNKEAVEMINKACCKLGITFLGFNNEKNYYDGKKTKLVLQCNSCGYIWKNTDFETLVHKGVSCRNCKTIWKVENKVKEMLINNDIPFEEQKKFDWLKNKSLLSLDFFLPTLKLFIECQGRQHFEPVERFGGKQAFKETQQRDIVKLTLCKEHGLKPIYYTTVKGFDKFLNETLVKNEEELIEKIKREHE